MGKVVICADSTCDLSNEQVERYDIHVLPLDIILGETAYKDGVDVTPDDIYKYVEQTGQLPKTAAGTYAMYLDWFQEKKRLGDEVIHFNISAEMSGTHQNCRMAAAEVEGCYAVDSRNLSTGIGQLVIEACVLRDEGKSAGEIVKIIDERKQELDVSFVLNTLNFMVKGGRCSSVAALGANLLKLKPCIEVRNGKMDVCKKYRGKLVSCLQEYVAERLGGKQNLRYDRIFVTHSGCSQEEIDAACQKVKEVQPHFKEIIVTRAGCSVSTHCGPATLGVLFFDKDLAK